ncbi:hypothetical protein HN748_02840 [Candidatus Peregrinibacteria bacterium]|nr:hypothetical protein [Candidatus Peregrinibacteria bacterium]MBT7484185.1 hypothetical protein [Candidatus Peregrinibacteria bacterium]MBT7703144.1 hypothetical protein [Candidatus Peregrinibacteria bacterium]
MAFRKKRIGTVSYRHPKIRGKRTIRRRSSGKTLSKLDSSSKTTERRKRQNTRCRSIWGQIKRILVLILAGTVAIYITYALFLSNTLTIQKITVFEDDFQLNEHPIATLLNDFKGSHLLLFNTDELEPYLQTQYPQYEKLKLSKSLPDTLTVVLESYPVVAKLTNTTEEGNEQQFFLTRAGRLADYDEILATEGNLREIFTESEQSLAVGADVMTQEKLAFILEAIQGFEDRFGMRVINAEYHDTQRETHLFTERNFYVWLDMTMSLDEQFDKLKKGLPRLNIYEMDLIYIDLRISGVNGEKIIFKRS